MLTAVGFTVTDLRKPAAMRGGGVLTPLAWASQRGDVQLLHWLASNGAAELEDVSAANTNGMTCMIRACMHGRLGACVWLAEHGALGDISRPSTFGWTPLLWACEGGHLHVVQWLVRVGASVRVKSASGRSPLFLACLGGPLELAKWIYSCLDADQGQVDVRSSDSYGKTSLHAACGGGHLAVVQWLWSVGASEDISRKDVCGRTPLDLACEGSSHLELCEWLYGAQKIVQRGGGGGGGGGGEAFCQGAFSI